ncbi:single-stranded DNA-binding protein [Patescibacteria group bacterium]|nr:single-stranded DNA-binding protein [Patescibacteria group bacterium]
MYSLNKAMIIGNLTRDPEVRTTPSGKSVANFSVATNFNWMGADGQKQEKVEYHNVVVWGKLAEICGQYLNKGKKIYIEGRLQTRDWEGQDGVKRTRTEIVADSMIMLGSPKDGNFSRSGANAPSAPSVPGEPTIEPIPEAPAPVQEGQEEVKVEDIPF